MNFLIFGAGGIGSYYGTKLLSSGHEVAFVARGKNLRAIQKNGLKLQHPRFEFSQNINIMDFDEFKIIAPSKLFDAIFITTKSTSTQNLSEELSEIYKNTYDDMPYIVSLQNGVENENILSNFLPKNKIIGALSRKIGAHIIAPGVIEATGKVETILGLIEETHQNKLFLQKLCLTIEQTGISCEITSNIQLELWKKLIINNGVNALCALLEIKTGPLMHHAKLSKIVYGLMRETATAAKEVNVFINKNNIDEMYNLITKFDSIKPSMLVDKESNRVLELDEICGIVIKYNERQNLDSPYTRTISTLLDFAYNPSKSI